MERAEILRRWYGGDNCKIPRGYLLDMLTLAGVRADDENPNLRKGLQELTMSNYILDGNQHRWTVIGECTISGMEECSGCK